MNETMTVMDKLKATFAICKQPIRVIVYAVFTVLSLFQPLIMAKYMFTGMGIIAFGVWVYWYRLLFHGRKECVPRWATLYAAFYWGSLVLLLLTVIVNCIRLFGSDSIVYDIVVYILVGMIAALLVTDIVLLLRSAKQEFKDEQDTQL